MAAEASSLAVRNDAEKRFLIGTPSSDDVAVAIEFPGIIPTGHRISIL
jgi:hypothetical protein